MHLLGQHVLLYFTGNFIQLSISSRKISSRIFQSCLLNGGIFLGSIIVFEVGMLLLPLSYHGWMLSSLFYWFWVYPIFFGSMLISNRMYRDIGHDAYVIFLGDSRRERGSLSQSLFSPIATQSYYWMLLAAMIGQAKLLYFVPFFGPVVSFMLFSVITAWYSFEYAWNSLNYTLERKVQILEGNWVYFLGFGTPLTLATFFSPFILNQGIFSFVFPFVKLKTKE